MILVREMFQMAASLKRYFFRSGGKALYRNGRRDERWGGGSGVGQRGGGGGIQKENTLLKIIHT
jgi:hypothetical protein